MVHSYLVFGACVLTAGCASLRSGRLESYAAFPIAPDAFASASAYTVIIVPKPMALMAEAGTAWQLLVRTERVESVVAVAADDLAVADVPCERTAGVLIAVLLGDPARSAGARGVLVAHDGNRCFATTGEVFACAAIPWDRVPQLPRVTIRRSGASTVEVERDTRVLAWYVQRLGAFPLAAEQHSTLPLEEWERIAEVESPWTAAKRAVVPAGVAGGAAGVLGTPLVGGIVGGVTFLTEFLRAILEPSMGPEHGDRLVSAQDALALAHGLQVHGVQCAERGSTAPVAVR